MSDSHPRITEEARALLARYRSITLATNDAHGRPEASYAPYVRIDDGAFYVYLSELSLHCRNLRDTGRVSVLLIEDESHAKELFARLRLTFECKVSEVARDEPPWAEVMREYEACFGDVARMILPLGDFHLWRLTPVRGTYVRGFGKAFTFEGSELGELSHVGPDEVRAARG